MHKFLSDSYFLSVLSPGAPKLRELLEGVAEVLLEEILVLGILLQVLSVSWGLMTIKDLK